MKKRIAVYAVWAVLACLLYFFENHTDTRIILACTLFLPCLPAVRHSLFREDQRTRKAMFLPRTTRSMVSREEDEPGDLRAYLPGDPVSRIHWKLSAKRDTLLVRPQATSSGQEETVSDTAREDSCPAGQRMQRRGLLIIALSGLLALVLLLLLPAARLGMQGILNRLFDASEASNAYLYDHFPVPDTQPVWPAVLLLVVMVLALTAVSLLTGTRAPMLFLIFACTVLQIYLGIRLPAGTNILLFTGLLFLLMARPWKWQAARTILCSMAALALAVLLLWPGMDVTTEAASEHARDWLSQTFLQISGTVRETPEGMTETRHVHTQSLTEGDLPARSARTFRLSTLEEKQISMPHHVNYLRIALLLLLTVVLLVLPFLPFAMLNRHRKQASEHIASFQSADTREAILAIFQQVIAWLEATGNASGNLPYARWEADLALHLSPEYALRFAGCEKLFEEAAYSSHPIPEDYRQRLLNLLRETEQTLKARADWKQRLRLIYRECLWT